MKKSFLTITILVLLFIFLSFDCQKKKSIENKSEIDSTLLQMDTAMIKGEKYVAMYRTTELLCILRNRDTIYKKHICITHGFDFECFNADQYKDLIISQISNVGGIKEVLLFDPADNSFKYIENLDLYPEPTNISNNLYYAYHRYGCADMNWISDLFEIKNNSTVLLGRIDGHGCDSDSKRIDIFKIRDNNEDLKDLMVTLPIDTIGKFPGSKWDFIKEYWTNYYSEFIK